MRVATAKALDERKIEISARCFNASGQTLTVQGVTGYVSGELRENGREPVSLGDMPLPWLIDTIDVTTWQDQTEMLIVLNQRISVGVPDAIQSLREGQSIFLTLDKLNVLIAWIQVSSATVALEAASSSAMASSGVRHPRVLRGRWFIKRATSFSSV